MDKEEYDEPPYLNADDLDKTEIKDVYKYNGRICYMTTVSGMRHLCKPGDRIRVHHAYNGMVTITEIMPAKLH